MAFTMVFVLVLLPAANLFEFGYVLFRFLENSSISKGLIVAIEVFYVIFCFFGMFLIPVLIIWGEASKYFGIFLIIFKLLLIRAVISDFIRKGYYIILFLDILTILWCLQ